MSSFAQKDSVREQLSAAEETIIQNGAGLCGQRRLLNLIWKVQSQIHITVLPQPNALKEENLCSQPMSFRVEQEEPGPPQTKTGLQKPNHPAMKEQLKEPQPPRIKKEQEGFFISQNNGLLDLKQEIDTWREIPFYEENKNSEAGMDNQQSFNVSDRQDEEGNIHKESTKDEETDPQNRDQKKKRDRSHVQNVEISHVSESQCDSDVSKKSKNPNLICNKHEPSPKQNRIAHNMRTETDETPYVCVECGRSFGDWAQFSNHMKIFIGEKHYSCIECNKSYRLRSTLIRHLRLHSGEKPFSCNECHKVFTCKGNLKMHQRIHTGEKAFSCNKCGKSFCYKGNLNVHMRTHTGEKPFSCLECCKSFSQACSLLRHLRMHTGEKPFSCNECDKTFRYKGHLNMHTISHMG